MQKIPNIIYEKFVLRIKSIIHLINKTKKVIVCVSGGSDSIFLLFLVHRFAIKNEIKILPLYVNHNLRSKKEIKKDIDIIKKFCDKNNLKLITTEIKPKKFDEDTLRKLRYKKILSIAYKKNCDVVLTGHTKNDLVETFFLNLIRGSGIKGLCSIPFLRVDNFKNKKIYIARPLIDITKNEIINVLKKQNIEYVVDKTNLKFVYKRNFLRNKILPLFKKINPNFEKNVVSASEILKEIYNFLEDEFNKKIKDIVKSTNFCVCIDLKKFLMYKEFAKKEILYRIISNFVLKTNLKLKQGYKKIVDKIINFLGKPNKLLNINKNLEVKKNKKILQLKYKNA